MLILAIETSTPLGSVALYRDDKLLGEYTLNIQRTHSERLMPAVDTLLRDAGVDIRELGGVAVALGPGSFTGLRIGVTTVKGLCFTLGIPAVGIVTLDAIAYGGKNTNGLVCPILNAKKNQVYTALYETNEDGFNRVSEYLALSPEELVALIREHGKTTFFMGDGVPIYQEYIKEALGELANFASQAFYLPRAAYVAELGYKAIKDGKIDDIVTLAPFYLRKSEAEIAWEKKVKCSEHNDTQNECKRC